MYQRCFAQPRICGELVHDEYGAGASAGLHSAFARPPEGHVRCRLRLPWRPDIQRGGLPDKALRHRGGHRSDLRQFDQIGDLIETQLRQGRAEHTILQKIIDLATTGQFTIPISRTAPLSEANSLIGDLEAGNRLPGKSRNRDGVTRGTSMMRDDNRLGFGM
ncbi:hypothetical protein [Rhizobium leguminosarum]|jgi:hypothetical protein|uniref:hypothetical protein n=1 Tax=Rhizobium leguminosarum TaxID=384 RepID=UPI001C912CE9|nr:hypothetical protein [Rhizobium leguminosarum]MBY3045987.1 hypothetical protein [Rhizobium leguminosarum]